MFRQKDNTTKRQKDKSTKRQKYKKTKIRQDKKAKTPSDKTTKRPEKEFNILMSGQFHTLAMLIFFLSDFIHLLWVVCTWWDWMDLCSLCAILLGALLCGANNSLALMKFKDYVCSSAFLKLSTVLSARHRLPPAAHKQLWSNIWNGQMWNPHRGLMD